MKQLACFCLLLILCGCTPTENPPVSIQETSVCEKETKETVLDYLCIFPAENYKTQGGITEQEKSLLFQNKILTQENDGKTLEIYKLKTTDNQNFSAEIIENKSSTVSHYLYKQNNGDATLAIHYYFHPTNFFTEFWEFDSKNNKWQQITENIPNIFVGDFEEQYGKIVDKNQAKIDYTFKEDSITATLYFVDDAGYNVEYNGELPTITLAWNGKNFEFENATN